MHKDEFLESAQFNYMHDLTWIMEQYPKENRTKPLTLIHGNSKKSELDQLAEVYTNVKLVKVNLKKYFFLKYIYKIELNYLRQNSSLLMEHIIQK